MRACPDMRVPSPRILPASALIYAINCQRSATSLRTTDSTIVNTDADKSALPDLRLIRHSGSLPWLTLNLPGEQLRLHAVCELRWIAFVWTCPAWPWHVMPDEPELKLIEKLYDPG